MSFILLTLSYWIIFSKTAAFVSQVILISLRNPGSLLLFRLFDIVKPWPVSALERGVPGAWGVVLDDVAARAMAGGCMTLALMAIAVG